jgi:hypothetical protein
MKKFQICRYCALNPALDPIRDGKATPDEYTPRSRKLQSHSQHNDPAFIVPRLSNGRLSAALHVVRATLFMVNVHSQLIAGHVVI